MYLSRLQLDSRSRRTWRDLVPSPYRVHQVVMQGFPDGVDRQAANVLHRLDVLENAVTLLVQSDVEPDWGGLDEALLLPAGAFDPIGNPAVRSLDDLALPAGGIYRFLLRANPSKRLASGKGNKAGKRVALHGEEEQVDWLRRKGSRHGFTLLDVRVQDEGTQKDRRRNLTIHTVVYQGLLRVDDEQAFRRSLRSGIGPARAFGCGLLSLAPA